MKEKQCEHQKHIIELQEKLKTNLSEVSITIIIIVTLLFLKDSS